MHPDPFRHGAAANVVRTPAMRLLVLEVGIPDRPDAATAGSQIKRGTSNRRPHQWMDILGAMFDYRGKAHFFEKVADALRKVAWACGGNVDGMQFRLQRG